MAAVISAILSMSRKRRAEHSEIPQSGAAEHIHSAVALAVIVDNRNPMMGFLRSVQAQILIAVAAVIAIATAAVLYAEWRRDGR